MADLTEKESSASTKIAGANSSGTEDNFLEVAADGSISSRTLDGSGNAITSTTDGGKQALDVNVANSFAAGIADKSTFTYGTSIENALGGVYQDTSPTLTAGQQGAVRLTQYRALHNNLRDSSGNEISSSAINSKQRLDVNLSSEAQDGAAIPYNVVMVGGENPSSNLEPIALDINNYALVSNAPIDGTKATYSAKTTGLVTASSATDVFIIAGSATKTIRVVRIQLSGTVGGIGGTTLNISLEKHNTAATGGTKTNPFQVPHDSNSAGATAVVSAYTANPTLGTLIGVLRVQKVYLPNTGNPLEPLIWEFGNRPSQAIVLRGTAEQLAINFGSTTLNSPLINIDIEWTEES